MTIEEEIDSLVVKNQFMNESFYASSTKTISKNTSMNQELRTHTNYSENDFDCY